MIRNPDLHGQLSLMVAVVSPIVVAVFLIQTGSQAAELAVTNVIEEHTFDREGSEGLTIVHSDDEVLILELSLPEVELSPVETPAGYFEKVQLAGYGNMADPGKPDLPQRGYLIAMPPGSKPSLSVLESSSYTIDSAPVIPSPEKRLAPGYDLLQLDEIPEFKVSYPKDLNTYEQETPYPSEIAEIEAISWLRDQRVARLVIRPVQAIPAKRRLTVYTSLRLQVRFHYPNGRSGLRTSRAESETFEKILRDSIVNYEQSLEWREPREHGATIRTSPCMDGNAYRIAITETAIYEIEHSRLASQGLPDNIPSDKIRMCHLDQEIGILVNDQGDGTFDDGDTVVFYGTAIKTQETATNVYWLTYSTGGANGLRMSHAADGPVGITANYYSPTIDLETDSKYYSLIPKADLNDHWYWAEPLVGETSNPMNTLDVLFSMNNKAPGAYSFPVRIELWAWVNFELHKFEVRLNGNSIGQGEFEGSYQVDPRYVFEVNAPSSALQNGTNTISIVALDNDGNTNNAGHRMLVNWIEVMPRRRFVAQGDQLDFVQPSTGNWNYAVTNFNSGAIVEVYEVTNALSPTYQPKLASDGSITFNRSAGGPAAYQLTTVASRLSPVTVEKDVLPNPPLRSGTNRADYIIITDPSLSNALTPLRTRRSNQGLDIITVSVQDIFDEFSYGLYDPEAIREFLAYANSNWLPPAPTYGLLAGEGSYDHRNVLGLNDEGANLVPVYLRSGIDSWLGEAAADNQYVDFNGDNLAQMLLGRLPALNSTELSNMVNKILAYEISSPRPDWQGDHLFATDNGLVQPDCSQDPAADFFVEVDNFITGHFPASHFLKKLYFAPADCYPDDEPHHAGTVGEMQTRLAQMYNRGNQFVVYTGHSSTKNWGHEDFLNTSTASSLSNGDMTPIMLPMTCLEGIYHFPQGDNLSETLLKSDIGGSVASYAPTGLQVQTGHEFLISGLYDGIFDDGDQILGQAIQKAKINLALNGSPAVQDLQDTFMLLGDPAMRLNMPDDLNQKFLPLVK